MRERKNILSSADPYLLILYIILLCIGCLNLYSTTFNEELNITSYEKQFIWAGVSIVLAFVILIIDLKFYESLAYFIYSFFLLLLIAVLIFGSTKKGAKSWFEIGGFIAIQPTEFVKFATALAISKYLSVKGIKLDRLSVKFIPILFLFLPVLLILLQPDAGSALVFFSLYLALYREGYPGSILGYGFLAIFLFLLSVYVDSKFWDLSWLDIKLPVKYLLMFFVSIIVIWLLRFVYPYKKKGLWLKIIGYIVVINMYILMVGNIFNSSLLEDRHRNRINGLLGLVEDKQGTGYNVHQSKIAIGSGGFMGKGFMQGTQTKYDFVPEQRTDFIFCTIGEEWGFIGTSFVVLLYTVLIIRIIFTSERQKSVFSRIYGYCVASIFFFHVAVNIGMTIGLVPVIGIPLPFLSYGGSALWAFTILLFIYIKLDSERKYILG